MSIDKLTPGCLVSFNSANNQGSEFWSLGVFIGQDNNHYKFYIKDLNKTVSYTDCWFLTVCMEVL